MNENKESEWKNRERGALWKKQGKSQNYLTGIIKSLDDMGQEVKNKVIVFANKNKTSENAPDFIIYESKDMNQADGETSATPAAATSDETSEEIPALLK
jgi:hypothetical protein|tara:strand:+ start:603 stop:899 length:297 start_codon:yes stop_codon:yes gene_type:complete